MGTAHYYRFSPWTPRSYEASIEHLGKDISVYDVVGERGAYPLRDRLVGAPRVGVRTAILRGLTDELREDIHEGLYDSDIEELFATDCSVLDCRTDDSPRLVDLRSGVTSPDNKQLLAVVREVEVRALLEWAGAIWKPTSYHYVLPSGQHCNRFVRVADVFASPIYAERIADWCMDAAAPATFVVLDSATMLPLAHAIAMRSLKQDAASVVPIRVLPLYAFTPERTAAAFAEIDQWYRAHRGQAAVILSIVSVSASGGYLDRFRAAIRACPSKPQVESIVVCNTGQSLGATVLTNVAVQAHAEDQCSDPANALEVEQQSFTTGVYIGVQTDPLPSYKEVQKLRPLMQALDELGAFRAHADRPQHGHLSIAVDTGRMLDCREFLSLANRSLAEATAEWPPDLVLVPDHDGTQPMLRWLKSRGIPNALQTRVDYAVGGDIVEEIKKAKRVLLVDDALITARTFRALHDMVQRTVTPDTETRALVLLGRTANERTASQFRKRFFVEGRNGFWIACNLPLPDTGTADAATCPWCNEYRFLGELLPTAEGAAREYLLDRTARLRRSDGLADRLLLLSDHPQVLDAEAATRTTPKSYLGMVSDAAAYPFAATLVQTVRQRWETEQTSNFQRRLLSVQPLRFYTDCVIAGSILRASRIGELWSAETGNEVKQVLLELEHPHQHPVLAAEILFAVSRGKLPRHLDLRGYVTPFAEYNGIWSVLDTLLRSL